MQLPKVLRNPASTILPPSPRLITTNCSQKLLNRLRCCIFRLRRFMDSEVNYFPLATKTLDWLIRCGQINEDFVRTSHPQQRPSWRVRGSEVIVEMSHLGSGSFAYVWK